MKPSQLAHALRQIAARIERSSTPSRVLVARDLRRVLANMGEAILINSWTKKAVKTGDVAGEAAKAIRAALESGQEVVGPEGDVLGEEDVDAAAEAFAAGDEIDGLLLTSEEGPEGVAVIFSSADRMEIAIPWPASEDEDFLGNGDPVVYATAGAASGQYVDGVEQA